MAKTEQSNRPARINTSLNRKYEHIDKKSSDTRGYGGIFERVLKDFPKTVGLDRRKKRTNKTRLGTASGTYNQLQRLNRVDGKPECDRRDC